MKRKEIDSTVNENDKKKLRSTEPDLKVMVGEEKAVRWFHAPTLASKSKYVDTMLYNPMKEQQSRVITFPDIEIGVWDDMIKFLDDPVACHEMDVKGVIKVAKHYDKYDFSGGRRLCDSILTKYFTELFKKSKHEAPDVDEIVQCVIMAHDTNLEKARDEGMKYIWKKLDDNSIPFGCTIFSKEQLEKLQPFLLQSRRNSAREREGRDIRLYLGGVSLESPDFAENFLKGKIRSIEIVTFWGFISHIEVSGTGCNVDGSYKKDFYMFTSDKIVRWGGVQHTFVIAQDEEGWAIARQTLPQVIGRDENGQEIIDEDNLEYTQCWIVPYSQDLPLPPHTGWKSVDPLARGEPKLKYILEKEGFMKNMYY